MFVIIGYLFESRSCHLYTVRDNVLKYYASVNRNLQLSICPALQVHITRPHHHFSLSYFTPKRQGGKDDRQGSKEYQNRHFGQNLQESHTTDHNIGHRRPHKSPWGTITIGINWIACSSFLANVDRKIPKFTAPNDKSRVTRNTQARWPA